MLVRYLPDGTLDDTFGSGGIVTVADDDLEIAHAVLHDGSSWSRSTAAALTRHERRRHHGPALRRHDGTLDPTFGVGGAVTIDFGGRRDEASGIVVDSAGRIVVAGWSWVTPTTVRNGTYVTAARLDAGVLDPTFGVGGKFEHSFGHRSAPTTPSTRSSSCRAARSSSADRRTSSIRSSIGRLSGRRPSCCASTTAAPSTAASARRWCGVSGKASTGSTTCCWRRTARSSRSAAAKPGSTAQRRGWRASTRASPRTPASATTGRRRPWRSASRRTRRREWSSPTATSWLPDSSTSRVRKATRTEPATTFS